MPDYDIIEEHNVQVAAPADVTFSAACEMDLMKSPVVRAIFKAREKVMGSAQAETRKVSSFLEETKAIGWEVLAEIPGREIVLGATTQPWMPNPVFRPIPTDAFPAFNEPDQVKIVWTLRADPLTETESVFRTQTRAIATDRSARRKFRLYWSFFSPGINLIRRMSLGVVKSEAERRVRGNADTGVVSQHATSA
jgi:hypothetical protein